MLISAAVVLFLVVAVERDALDVVDGLELLFDAVSDELVFDINVVEVVIDVEVVVDVVEVVVV